MFHIDATFEDLRIIAREPVLDEVDVFEPVGTEYMVKIIDSLTGNFKEIILPADHLSMILQFNLNVGGEPKNYEEYYKVLEPIFKGWPKQLRPFP